MKNVLSLVLCFFICGLSNMAISNDLKTAHALYKEGKVKEAFTLYLKPELCNNPRVQNRLGNIYLEPDFRDEKESARWFTKAAEQGDVDGIYNLGIAYRQGIGVKQEYQKAFQLYTKAADMGLPAAMNALGMMYDHGYGVKADDRQAMKLYSMAANEGYIPARCNAAGLLMYSKEVKHHYESAGKLLAWCLEDDPENVCCLNRMAELDFDGRGVKEDRKKAIELREKAAALGSEVAMYNLGTVYDYGLGVKKDARAAMGWYLKASAKNHAKAMYRLYEAYEYGKLGQTVDKAKAAEWKAKAETAMKEQGLSRNELMDSFRLLMEADEN